MSQFYQQLSKLTPEQRALFEKKLAEKGLQAPKVGTIPQRSPGQPIPLSFAQQRLWFVQQLDPENTAYNVASVFKLQGSLDFLALEKSLNTLVERHETLRTRFVSNRENQPKQVIDSPSFRPLERVDLTASEYPKDSAHRKIQEITQTPFDLTQSILRTALLKLEEEIHLLVLTTHHIVSDRWSVMVFLREMTILYRAFSQGMGSPLPPLLVQYADWAIWQRQQLQGDKLQQQLHYWTTQLDGELPVLDLPRDRGYGAVATYRGAQVPIQITPDCSEQLKSLASRHQVTLFTLLLTTFKVLLHRYTNSDDIVVGSDIANRDRTETEGLIGLLVNTLVFRSDLSNNPRFSDLLNQVRETVVNGLAHQDLPFEKLVEAINPERHLSQMMPLFQVKLDLQQVNVKPMELDGLTLERYPLQDNQAKYELRFNLQDTEQGISGQVEYNCDLFDADTIVRMVGHWQILLEGIVADVHQRLSQLPLLKEQEKNTLLINWNQTQQDYPTDSCIHELFEKQVEKSPDAVAVDDGDISLTYAELNVEANRLAWHLRSQQVAPETRIGICMDRSWHMVVGLLAILKAGGTYVPLDPAYPKERLELIVQDAEIPLLLTQKGTFETDQAVQVIDLEKLSENEEISREDAIGAPGPQTPNAGGFESYPKENLDINVTSNHLAYVIYTSGSTGRPKGVAIEHRSTVAMLHWAQEQFTTEEISGVLAATSVCFDLSVFELFVPLSWGGRVVLVENALTLPKLPDKANVSLINTVPSVLNQLLKLSPLPNSIRVVNLAGEALPVTLVQQLQTISHVQKIYNLYGPSEDTTYSTCAPLHTGTVERVPIGKPITNTQAYVLDRYQQPVPVGVVGELYLGGAGLARGYLNRPELTTEKFVENPLADFPFRLPTSDFRLYRTGDRVRYLPDGSLEFLGRFDHQVKIRGFRIEIGEVETALRKHPAVQDVVVTVYGEQEKTLVAYVVPKEAAEDSDSLTKKLRSDLLATLPDYLVPTLWVQMEALPQLPNGKVNRRALPRPEVQSRGIYVAPRSSLEKTLATIWGDVLQQATVGIHDNFFELGGHSLLGIQIVAQAEAALGYSIPLRTLFQAPTIAGFAALLETDNTSTEAVEQFPNINADLPQRHQPFPLTDIQQAYWLGRVQAFELGNIGTHGYREFDISGLSMVQVEQALNRLIERHDMLRAVVNSEGQQQILAEVPHYSIAVTDLRANTAVHKDARLTELRDRMSHQVFTPDQWPLFQIEAAQLEDNKVRFYVSFDVLIGDAWSFQLLGREMAQLIRGESLTPLSISFRDYVLAEQAFRQTSAYEKAMDYWQQKLPKIPPAPDLPLTMAPSQVDSPKFERRSGRLEPELWQRLKQKAHAANLTPSGLVLAAFAEILTIWSRQPQFTLNLTLFNRQPVHPDVNYLVGDFTASLLLAVDNGGSDTFTTRAQRLQTQLWNDLDNRAVSGVQVLRELARQQNRSPGALMPVVFTSTLSQAIPATASRDWQTETVYSVSQTSQVYLDHQVSEIAGALVFNWDAISSLFPAGMLDQMFAAYDQLLNQLATDNWQTLPRLAPADYLLEINQTSKVLTKEQHLLHTLFFERVQQQPDHPAVITPERTLTYKELAQQVHALSHRLETSPNQLVAVSMAKGWQQVVAVLAILTAGAAYVPIDPTLPQERRWQLLGDTAAEIVLTVEPGGWPEHVQQLTVNFVDLVFDNIAWEPLQRETDLAYVIYTSGSTGTPKGVMIDHRGAVNTILDINQRFEVGEDDRIFALSSLSFDLSVYDIFGTLAAGATMVIPDADQVKNTVHWRQLLIEHQVTIWNSVPALMQLLLSELNNGENTATHIRLALLSGDWIPLTLPDQFKQRCPKADLISLGGATEASIWSIFYPIDTVDPSWSSIPYGRPLANQQWYVLDENLQPCPPWVPGHLYISGIGLAKGYWNQPELTAERFIESPFEKAGEQSSSLPTLTPSLHLPSEFRIPNSEFRLYKTGDLGRYLSDGNLEFLGREDFQVKSNGYRIELGEIETALQQYTAIESAVVNAVGTPPELVAYVVPKVGNALNQPLAKLEFKQQQLGIRAIAHSEETVELPLPESHTSEDLLRRQSHRQFLEQPVTLARFSQFLSALKSQSFPTAPLPKYRYASAGSLYPIQTYVHVKENRIAGLVAGWYYYHPAEHHLVRLAESPSSSNLYGPHQQLHDDSAFSLFLVAQMEAIEPVYGDKARDFCLIETGYMGQLLMEKAPDFDLGLCPIGGFNSDALREILDLSEHYQPLHALVGGAIDTQWSQQWMVNAPRSVSITDTLRKHLSNTLPSYMVPTRYQILEKIPLTPNGKVDRRALPVPALGATTEYIAPNTPTEIKIVQLWQTLLEVEQVGINDNFFEVGGNSLTAMQLLSKLQQTFSTELTIAQLFGSLTPALQAQLVDSSVGASQQEAIQPAARETDLPDITTLSDIDVDDMLAQLLAENDQQEVTP
ncbi:MAG: amino acid adenylation domain-containing protein [Cyanobacteria bacterium P01_D01_bin.156]